jgi:hypothetical protein
MTGWQEDTATGYVIDHFLFFVLHSSTVLRPSLRVHAAPRLAPAAAGVYNGLARPRLCG